MKPKKKWAVHQSLSKIDYSAGFEPEPAGYFYASDMREAARVFANRVYIAHGHWAKIVLVDDE